MPFLCCCPDVFGFTRRRRGDIDDDEDVIGGGDTTDDADARLADIVGSDEEDEDEDEDENAHFGGRHHGRRHGRRRRQRRRRTLVEGSLLGDAHQRERSDVMEEEYDAMRRESSASAPPVGMRSAVTTTTPRSGGSEAFYYDDEGQKGTRMTTTHRRSVSMAVVGDDGGDAGKIADAELLATIKREFARTKSLSFDRRGGARGDDDKLEDGLSSSKTTTMSKMMSDDYDATCPTCFEEYDEENPRITLGCGHHFHLPCVLEWREYLELQGREDTCPVCDAPIVLDGF